MGIIARLTPLNILEEKEKFLSNQRYNPQFTYLEPVDPQIVISYGLPRPQIVEYTKHNLEKWQPPEDLDVAVKPISEEYILNKVETFNRRLNIERKIEVVFSDTLSGKCQIKGTVLTFRTPIQLDEEQLINTFNHELESHFLRSYNDTLQPWHDLSKRVDQKLRRTEEGIAQLHGYLARENKQAYKANLVYYAVSLALTGSFSDVVKQLLELGLTLDYATAIAIRVKRGLTDTSLPGGFTKDITYLEGMIEVYRYLITENRDPEDLYLGKIAISEIEEKKPTAVSDKLLYPSFFDNMDLYLQLITSIGKSNNFDQL